MTRYLITGATGFVGAALALELLARTDATLTCLVRPYGATARERLAGALRTAAALYELDHLIPEIAARCEAVPGDLTDDYCGLADIGPVDEVWHVAASLAFEQRHKQELLRSNVAGTANALALGRRAGARAFNHVSTAYVAGNSAGWIPAAPVTSTDQCNNWYEHSKVLGENLVLESDFPVARILRPTIVIGHSENFATTSFTGLYGFITGLRLARAEVRKHLGDMLVFRPLRIRANAQARINFLPIDRTVAAAVSISLAGENGGSGSGSGIYHLANLNQPTMGDCMRVLGASLAIKTPECVSDPDEFTLLDERVDRRLEFYRSYLSATKDFDVTETIKVAGESVLNYELPDDRLLKIVRWYLDNPAKRA